MTLNLLKKSVKKGMNASKSRNTRMLFSTIQKLCEETRKMQRAASYTKLGAMPEGLKDPNKCIEIAPKFSKEYTRKGAIQFFMKEYDKALEMYQEGLKHDPQNPELLEGVRSCVQQINRATCGDLTPDELKERQAKAMQDPEIQNILTDPVLAQVLKDLQENPKAAQDHMKNPSVMNKIQQPISAGIVQMR